MLEMKGKKAHYLVCFRCGSFDVFLLNEVGNRSVYSCKNCGKVWVTMGVNVYEKK